MRSFSFSLASSTVLEIAISHPLTSWLRAYSITPKQQQVLFQEGRLILAVQAYKQGQIPALFTATRMYNMPQSTAQLRIKGIQLKRSSIASNCRLISV